MPSAAPEGSPEGDLQPQEASEQRAVVLAVEVQVALVVLGSSTVRGLCHAAAEVVDHPRRGCGHELHR